MDNRIRTFIRNTNKRLTRVGLELGLSLKVTSYVARHCFATIQKNIKEVPRNTIKEGEWLGPITNTIFLLAMIIAVFFLLIRNISNRNKKRRRRIT